MSWLATWFIVELIVVGAVPNLSEPQAFKNVSLQMIIDQTFPFRRIFCKKFHHIQVLTFDINGQSGSGNITLLPLPASASLLMWKFLLLFRSGAFQQDVGVGMDYSP